MLAILKSIVIFVMISACTHESYDDYTAYNPGLCYQPLYWPSECIQPDPPTPQEINKARRAYYKKKRLERE